MGCTKFRRIALNQMILAGLSDQLTVLLLGPFST